MDNDEINMDAELPVPDLAQQPQQQEQSTTIPTPTSPDPLVSVPHVIGLEPHERKISFDYIKIREDCFDFNSFITNSLGLLAAEHAQVHTSECRCTQAQAVCSEMSVTKTRVRSTDIG